MDALAPTVELAEDLPDSVKTADVDETPDEKFVIGEGPYLLQRQEWRSSQGW